YHQPTNNWFSALMQDRPAANWVFITTRRLLWANPDLQLSCDLRHENVDSVAFLSNSEVEPSISSSSDWPIHAEKSKEDWMNSGVWLRVVDFSGSRYKIFVEHRTATKIRNTIWQLSGGWRLAFSRAEQENLKSKIKFAIGPQFEKGSDEYKASRLERAILKHGVAYSSRFFDVLAPDIQAFFLKEIELHQGEIPAFFFFENQETWFAATSRRVLWSRPGFKHQLKYGQICGMGQSEMREFEKKGKKTVAITEKYIKERSREAGRIKTTSPWFYFTDDKGNRYEALLPPGGPLFAIWNSILAIVSIEK
ncbi:MAG: hypothetical protein K2X81_26725, partial [Candidatus Obscuribacterales bacterium]|nr:hypothetical protein [Candidatus Obscuribacterales bacterium]